MVRHVLDLHDSFEHLHTLDQAIQLRIRDIMVELEKDAYFVPSAEEYSVEKRPKGWYQCGDYTVCQHISGWQGWSLVWFFEYFQTEPSTPEKVVLMLWHKSPQEKLQPQMPN